MSRQSYEQLIAENIAWLLSMPRTLERDHIELVLRASPNHEYPLEPTVAATRYAYMHNALQETRAQVAKLQDTLTMVKAERDVWSGEACKQEQANGKGLCGGCRHCYPQIIADLQAQLLKAQLDLAMAQLSNAPARAPALPSSSPLPEPASEEIEEVLEELWEEYAALTREIELHSLGDRPSSPGVRTLQRHSELRALLASHPRKGDI